MPAVFEAARLIASAFDSYIEGFAVRPSVVDYVNIEPLGALAISAENDSGATMQARAQFESFMQAHGVIRAEQGPAVVSYGWPRTEAADDNFIGSYGRIFDLIALGRPGRGPENPRMLPLEAALFDSGRPVLVVPSMVPVSIGRNILISWNGSTEQARTNAYALPLLHRAERVTLLTVEGGTAPGPSGEEAARHLRRNGIAVTASTIKPGTHATGEVILDHAAQLGCDLLVKSAYTQSRLRQMVFGGATRHILANANLPVFMAH